MIGKKIIYKHLGEDHIGKILDKIRAQHWNRSLIDFYLVQTDDLEIRLVDPKDIVSVSTVDVIDFR